MPSTGRVQRAGLLSAIAGALFVPYALSKGRLSTLIVAEGWHLIGLSAGETARLFHVLEAVPLVFMAVGLVALDVHVGARGRLADAGVSVALVGVGLTVLTHFGEHLLTPFTVPSLTGGADWFLWGYYLSWLTLYAGIAVYGVALARTGDASGRLPWLFVFVAPSAAAVSLAVWALDLFTVAGTFRVIYGLTWVYAGVWLWSGPGGPPIPGRSNPVAGHGTDDR